ncbi:MarR family transcriptional regulator [Amycolatopsis dongchuanensis]|uniref:MarR family transcriptional regulator n=2 Tax=Pseudonocardiaceae TaxID=2070 RepID=A0ABP9Q239_9PSEU
MLERMTGDRSTGATVPRWLDDEQLATWRMLMSFVARLPTALECQLQQDSQLRFLEYYVLAVLAEQPERRMRMSRLAVRTHSELSRLSHLMARLQARGFVDREPDPRDGRFTLAILTDAGFAQLAGAAPGHVARVRELVIDALQPEELSALAGILSKLHARLVPDHRDAADHG